MKSILTFDSFRHTQSEMFYPIGAIFHGANLVVTTRSNILS